MTVKVEAAGSRMDPRIRERRVSVTRQRGRRRLRVLLCGCGAVGVVVGGVVLLHSSLLSARHVSVRGARHTSANLVMAVAGLSRHPPLIDVDPGQISLRLERLPWIATAVVHKRWPDSLTIDLTERTPLVYLFAAGGFDVVDASGRVLEHEQNAPARSVSLSVSEAGFRVPTRPGSVLASAARAGLLVAESIPPALRPRIQGISVAYAGVSLTLSGDLSVVLGSDDELEQKFESLASLLSAEHLSGPARIDLTVPDELSVTPGAS